MTLPSSSLRASTVGSKTRDEQAPVFGQRTRRLFWALMLGCTVGLLAAIVAAVSIGAVRVPFDLVVRVIGRHVLPGGGGIAVDWMPVQDQIIWQFRLPRTLLAVVVGAGLAVTGTVLQAIVRNPLADPYLLGVSSGATFGAVAVIVLGSAVLGGVSLSIAAFAGALLAMTLVYLLARQGGRLVPTRLILAGVALAYVFSSAASFVILQARDPQAANSVLFWQLGSVAAAKWSFLGLPSLVLVVATGYLVLQSDALNALLMGEEAAIGLGVDVDRFRQTLFVLTSLVVGVIIALSGSIGFVGLMVPHIVRLVIGSEHRRVLPLAALAGALLLVIVDLVARTVIAPVELPIGIITAALGAPFFLVLLRRKGGRFPGGATRSS